MNTIVINVNGTILNLTVKRGSTVSVSFAEVAEEQLVAEEVGEEQVAEEENQNSLISFQEQAPEENEISVISFQEQAPEENEISVISFHEEPEISDTDSAYNYIELCKPAKVHSYERDHAGNYTKEKMQYHV
jgi:sorbitol-specific phosphotransferase system component IIA